jgi:hypothetical protein
MSKIIKNFAILMLFVTTIILFSCAKDGADGLPGAAGSAGLNGVNGKDGAAGANGKDGNANVQGKVYNVKANDWVKTNYTGSSTYYYSVVFNIPEITQAVMDRGLVMCYRTGPNTTLWFAMPYSYSYASGSTTKVVSYDAVHFLGKEVITITDTDDLPTAPSTEQNYKVVVITPSGLAANPNINYKNYAEVAATFGLE